MKRLLLLLFFVQLLNACTSSRKKENLSQNKEVTTPFIVHIEKNLDNVQALPVSLVAKQLEYIPLETNKRCLLKKVDKIAFTDSFIFVSDFSRLLQFNRKGKFIRQIGRNGKGPGEYIYVMEFCIDPFSDQIYIVDYVQRIEIFNLSGKYIRQFSSTKIPSFNMFVFSKDKLIFHFANAPKHVDSTETSLLITDLNGGPLKVFRNYNKRKSKPGIIVPNSPFYAYQGKFCFMEYANDTLFAIEDQQLVPKAIFDLGSMKMDHDHPLAEQKDFIELRKKLRISKIKENDKFLFITLQHGFGDDYKYGVFDKEEKKMVFLTDGFENDVDGGISFYPKYIYNDNILVDYMDASDFREQLASAEGGESTPTVKRLIHDIKDEDNPVLIVAR